MPTYEYRCKTCDHELEVVQKFTDDPLETCPECGGPLRKVYGNVGISFKGSGFYKNDTRSKTGSSSGASTGAGDRSTKSDSSSGDGGSSDTKSSKTGDGKSSSSGSGSGDSAKSSSAA